MFWSSISSAAEREIAVKFLRPLSLGPSFESVIELPTFFFLTFPPPRKTLQKKIAKARKGSFGNAELWRIIGNAEIFYQEQVRNLHRALLGRKGESSRQCCIHSVILIQIVCFIPRSIQITNFPKPRPAEQFA